MSKKKNKKKSKLTISGIELLLNSKGKQGRHIPEVRTGTGVHKSKKQYTRKLKHKKKEW